MFRRACFALLSIGCFACSSGYRGDSAPASVDSSSSAESSLRGSAKGSSSSTVTKAPISTFKAEKLPGNERSPIGTNLSQLTDYSGEWAFVDAFKQSRHWISGTRERWQDDRELIKDEHGWIKSLQSGQIARTLFFWNEWGLEYPSGSYIVLYDGQGTMEWVNAKVSDQQPGRLVLEVNASPHGFALNITSTNPANYLRNIRILMPGGSCEADSATHCLIDNECGEKKCIPFERNYQTQIFHPIFLSRLKSYSILRYMEWMNTTSVTPVHFPQVDWKDRPKVTDARWTEKGVPVEIMVELANRVGADPWFTMFHLAKDEYITEFAKVVKEKLAPERKAWVEHSNEVWNQSFDQARYVLRRGKELGLGANDFEAALRYHSTRSVETFALWSKVFGGDQRLVRVMGSMAVNPWVSEQLLAYKNAAKQTDVLAIAPYFGGYLGHPEASSQVKKLSLDQLLDELDKRGLDESLKMMRDSAAVAKRAGVRLVAYEGGQHLSPVGPAAEDKDVAAKLQDLNRHPRMKGLYSKYLSQWKESGGTWFVHYNHCVKYTKWGSWGAIETLTAPRETSPKFDALLEFIEKNPRWW